MKTWKTKVDLKINNTYAKTKEIKIQRGIFQKDLLNGL